MPIVVSRKKAQDPKNREEQIRKRLEELRKRNRRKPAPGAGMGLLKPSAGMLTGGQAKLDRNKNNRIDAQDFKILRAEKAKGRGKGLQDEKMKPGKVMKADKGGMGEAKGYKKYLKGLKKAEGEQFRAKFKAKEIAKAGGKAALRAAKASRIGKIALGIAGVGLAAKEYLKTRARKKRERDAVRGLEEDMAVEKLQEQVKKGNKKMGGGMMKKVPGYKKGSLNQGTFSIGPFKPKPGGSKPSLDDYDQMKRKRKLMGGGMMMRPVPMGMKSGKSVKVKCKLGRNKPTKMY